MSTESTLPTYDELPVDPNAPPHTAWGLWGEDDNLGTLNLLTPDKVVKATSLVSRGDVFALNWKLENPNMGMLNRDACTHIIKPIHGDMVFDDVYDGFNTQASSQWDGLRHFCLSTSGQFYNNTSAEEIKDPKNGKIGVHHMARRGIVGRAVLLDFARWAEVNVPDYDAFTRYEITVEELDAVAAHQGVTFEEGDILLLRTGWTARYEVKKAEDTLPVLNAALGELPDSAGLKFSEDTFRWVWNHHFAAIASDNIGVEALPFINPYAGTCHSMFLSGWGMPLGEMFFLEALAEDCAKDGVYQFFFSSAPLNKFGGVASPPNALVIK
ncbi:putative cyclase-domain-containing protein [Phycomyces blakesleeanus]|uniref:Cyclase-domain-containing protein n=1 Tax=Phycomyces blakesleeanus TaxID=4837 RepID=A0ABR3AW86_PHYBL